MKQYMRGVKYIYNHTVKKPYDFLTEICRFERFKPNRQIIVFKSTLLANKTTAVYSSRRDLTFRKQEKSFVLHEIGEF